MRSSTGLSFYTVISLNIFRAASAIVLESRHSAAAKTTTYPTVPSFSAPSFTYQAFSDAYPSGYTLPSAPFITTSASSSAIPSSSSTLGSRPSEYAEASYLRSMCAPYYDFNLNFPCNRVTNSSRTCIYNATLDDIANARNGGTPLGHNSPQEQQHCLCPGGKGQRLWEDLEGCNECLRLHGAPPLGKSDLDVLAFVPTVHIEEVSSAYCAQKTASKVWRYFVDNFYMTHPIVYGSEIWGTDLLRSKTAVSNYFTETSGMTPVITTKPQSTSTTPDITTKSQSRQTASTSQTPVTLKPASTLKTSANGTPTAAAAPTGGATSLRASAFIAGGLVGVAWFL